MVGKHRFSSSDKNAAVTRQLAGQMRLRSPALLSRLIRGVNEKGSGSAGAAASRGIFLPLMFYLNAGTNESIEGRRC